LGVGTPSASVFGTHLEGVGILVSVGESNRDRSVSTVGLSVSSASSVNALVKFVGSGSGLGVMSQSDSATA